MIKTLEGKCKSCEKESSIAEQSIRQKCYLEKYDGQHCKELNNCDGYAKNFCWTPEYRTKK